MSMVLLPPLSVCSLISLSVSSCVLAGPAGPSCYHGDESRHRLSAVISCMLPTGIFLDSPLVIICVLSFHHKGTLSPSLCPFKLCTLLSSPRLIPLCCLLLCPSLTPTPPPRPVPPSPAVVSSPRWQICSSRKPQPLDLITDAQDGATINTSHWWSSSPLPYSSLLQQIRRYYPPHSPLLPIPSSVTSLCSLPHLCPRPSLAHYPSSPPSSVPHL